MSAGPNTYIDFPGDPRVPGCDYESVFKGKAGSLSLQPTVYARVAIDQGKRKLYLQYWFYYLFNDWNNTHESDWEMVPLVFKTTEPAEALAIGPDRGRVRPTRRREAHGWRERQIERDGTHLVAYLGAGSHATYPTADP